jgi:hypothetical protein
MPRPRWFAGRLTVRDPLLPAENITRSPTAMVPASGCSRPAIERSVVVFPQPEGPSRVNSSPSWTSKLTSSTAKTVDGPSAGFFRLALSPAKVLTRWSMRSMGVWSFPTVTQRERGSRGGSLCLASCQSSRRPTFAPSL